MIEMPRRSVTRFFIPLVDVVMLLFSMFLLMPVLEAGNILSSDLRKMTHEDLLRTSESMQQQLKELQEAGREKDALEKRLVALQKELRELRPYAAPQIDIEKLRRELEQLRREKIDTLSKRLFIRVLEIDPQDGKLVYYEPGQPPKQAVIRSQADARALIESDRQRPEARDRELYYLFLFPRIDSAFPEQRQFEQYRRWFGDVAYGTDLSTKALSSG